MTLERDELYLGFVGALGADLDSLVSLLRSLLSNRYGYSVIDVHLSDLVKSLDPSKSLRPGCDEAERVEFLMNACDSLRRKTGYPDCVARLVLGALTNQRGLKPVSGTAFNIVSLKRPEEVAYLRAQLGSAFWLIGAYSDRTQRVNRFSEKIATSRAEQINKAVFRSAAERLVVRDEIGYSDDKARPAEFERHQRFGQNVKDTFPLADFFVNLDLEPHALEESISRFLEVVFRYPFHTPKKDEMGMFLAMAASRRSSSLARQVGAALCAEGGELLAIGTNENAKVGGGAFWADDEPDHRDFVLGSDASDRMKKAGLYDLVERLQRLGYVTIRGNEKRTARSGGAWLRGGVSGYLKDAAWMKAIEFSRAVHAEMLAMMDAARHGIPVAGCTLFSTTYPCHDCAKHVIAAGIRRVVFLEPYPKSLTEELYKHQISTGPTAPKRTGTVLFESFQGFAPRRFLEVFEWSNRKDAEGGKMYWVAAEARPVVGSHPLRNPMMERGVYMGHWFEISELAKLLKVKGYRSSNRRVKEHPSGLKRKE